MPCLVGGGRLPYCSKIANCSEVPTLKVQWRVFLTAVHFSPALPQKPFLLGTSSKGFLLVVVQCFLWDSGFDGLN